MQSVTVALIFVSSFVYLTTGLPTGAPIVCCGTMTPAHNESAQTIDSPFATIPQKTQLMVGETVTLNIVALNPTVDSFRGYLVEAFDSAAPEGNMIGTFSNPSDGQILDCPRQPSNQNAVTHVDNLDKTNVSVDWTPPPNFSGSVFFKTSFVKIFSTYWVKTISSAITIQ